MVMQGDGSAILSCEVIEGSLHGIFLSLIHQGSLALIGNERHSSGRALVVSSPAHSAEATIRSIDVLAVFADSTLTTPVSGYFAGIEDMRACNAKQRGGLISH